MVAHVRFMFLYKDNDMAEPSTDQKPDPLEDEIDALIAEFGSARAACVKRQQGARSTPTSAHVRRD